MKKMFGLNENEIWNTKIFTNTRFIIAPILLISINYQAKTKIEVDEVLIDLLEMISFVLIYFTFWNIDMNTSKFSSKIVERHWLYLSELKRYILNSVCITLDLRTNENDLSFRCNNRIICLHSS